MTSLWLWKIEGESSDDNGGGHTVVYAFTGGPADYPDPDQALERADPGSAWYSIRSIERMGPVPMAWREGNAPCDYRDFVESIGLVQEWADATRRRLVAPPGRLLAPPGDRGGMVLPFARPALRDGATGTPGPRPPA